MVQRFCLLRRRSVSCLIILEGRGYSVSCPICDRRKPARFCPAKGEKICAVCCGTEREVTIDCPSDCSYLIAAHRYESKHPRSLPAGTALLDETDRKSVV